ncbi:MAG: D-aminoacyl-tRNA deacylase, partial [Bacteroidales bacterium]|nr:D-aminoacyl-tRNA deacylase [Bacteroidales bacterium]
MRIVIQRVKKASVSIQNKIHSAIGQGMLILLGIEDADDFSDADWLISKIIKLRIFDD